MPGRGYAARLLAWRQWALRHMRLPEEAEGAVETAATQAAKVVVKAEGPEGREADTSHPLLQVQHHLRHPISNPAGVADTEAKEAKAVSGGEKAGAGETAVAEAEMVARAATKAAMVAMVAPAAERAVVVEVVAHKGAGVGRVAGGEYSLEPQASVAVVVTDLLEVEAVPGRLRAAMAATTGAAAVLGGAAA